jgi:D-beta-D-heptose 7-phosphate kinase/D-beta-D-heptose 1-phosphate adenosyltransferase
MAISRGIFGPTANFDERLMPSLEALGEAVHHLKGIGLRIVLTSGSFDLIHLGHVKYLAEAKALGDVLVVGVDSDEKIRRRKGDDRPLVPERERLEMLAHQRPVDILYLKSDDDARWALIKTVAPDVLVLTEDHGYTDAELAELGEVCGKIEILERQASITTSERIRQIYMNLGERLGPLLAEALPGLIDSLLKKA